MLQALGREEKDMDTLLRETGLAPGAAAHARLALQMKRRISQLPGKRFAARLAGLEGAGA